MISNTKAGYVTLEAAMVLPIVIIGILTLGYFIKIYSTAENITYSMIDEAGRLAAQAYGRKAAPSFPAKLEARVREENNSLERIQTVNFRYLYSDGGKDGLIALGCRYRIALALPIRLTDSVELESRLKCRGFTGTQSAGTAMPFSDMEKNGDSSMVLVFPMWGEKFHTKACRFVSASALQKVLTPQLKRQYKPCRLCRPESLPTGSYVYCFLRAGEVYHQKSCHTVEKYTIEMEKEDAWSKGYRPCKTCGGG